MKKSWKEKLRKKAPSESIAFEVPGLKDSGKVVLTDLETIAKESGLSEAEVRKAHARLEDLGLVRTVWKSDELPVKK